MMRSLKLILLAAALTCVAVDPAPAFGVTSAINIGPMFSAMSTGMVQGASLIFAGIGYVILIAAMVTGVRRATDGSSLAFALITPIILAACMQYSVDGNGEPGWCSYAGQVGDALAAQINPSMAPGGVFTFLTIFALVTTQIMGQGTMANNAQSNVETTDPNAAANTSLSSDPSPASLDPSDPSPPAPDTTTPDNGGMLHQMGSWTSGAFNNLSNMGGTLIQSITGVGFFSLIMNVAGSSIFLLYLAQIVMQIFMAFRIFLLALSSIFLPMFIAALGVSNLRGIGENYIKSIIGIASWPMGWAAGHIGTAMLVELAVSYAISPQGFFAAISGIFISAVLIMLIPFWILAVTFVGPFAMARMITSGSNFGSELLKSAVSSGTQAASTAMSQGASAGAGASPSPASASPSSAPSSSGTSSPTSSVASSSGSSGSEAATGATSHSTSAAASDASSTGSSSASAPASSSSSLMNNSLISGSTNPMGQAIQSGIRTSINDIDGQGQGDPMGGGGGAAPGEQPQEQSSGLIPGMGTPYQFANRNAPTNYQQPRS